MQIFPPANVVFAGVGLLLAVCITFPSCLRIQFDTQNLKAAKGVSDSYDALIELFECFERFLGRLKVLTAIPHAMGEILIKIMVELLKVLALATQQINQGRLSEFVIVDVVTFRLACMIQGNLQKS